jgi:RNA polymerase sigma-70 factor (ECF subfamily)
MRETFGERATTLRPSFPGSRSLRVVGAPGRQLEVQTAQELAGHIEAIARGRDRQAFAALFQHFGPRLKTFYLRGGASPGLAEDLAQETMLSVWRKAALFDRSRAGAATWVFTIARNLRIDQARRERKPTAPLHEPEDVEPSAEEFVLGEERDVRVRNALVALSDEQVSVIRMSFYAEKSQSEIARELGIPLGTVKSRARLAMNRLRALLEDER